MQLAGNNARPSHPPLRLDAPFLLETVSLSYYIRALHTQPPISKPTKMPPTSSHLIIISGPSGVGKDTLIHKLITTHPNTFSLTNLAHNTSTARQRIPRESLVIRRFTHIQRSHLARCLRRKRHIQRAPVRHEQKSHRGSTGQGANSCAGY